MAWRGLRIIAAAVGFPLRKEAAIKITLKTLYLDFLHYTTSRILENQRIVMARIHRFIAVLFANI
jgi:hypothetical protein